PFALRVDVVERKPAFELRANGFDVRAGRELHEDVRRVAAQIAGITALREAVIEKRERRCRERFRVDRAADDLQSTAEDFAIFADFEFAVALRRRLIEKEVRPAPQILEVPLGHIPRKAPSREIL